MKNIWGTFPTYISTKKDPIFQKQNQTLISAMSGMQTICPFKTIFDPFRTLLSLCLDLFIETYTVHSPKQLR